MARSGSRSRPPSGLPGDPPRSGRLVQVFASQSIPEGMLARGLLQTASIPVVEKGMGESPYRMGPVYLWVPEEVEVQARLLLADAKAGALDAIGEAEV